MSSSMDTAAATAGGATAAVLTRALLGPSRTSVRVAELRASRAASVEDADARLRRIERDLHDGTQARLVAVAEKGTASFTGGV